jgi:hypothetical protein
MPCACAKTKARCGRHCQLVERLGQLPAGMRYWRHEPTSYQPRQAPPLPGRDHQPWGWLYFRCCLRYRDVEEWRFARGLIVTYAASRKWCRKLGQESAPPLRRWRPRPGDQWPLDAVFRTINGARHDLWRAVEQDGHVLAMLVPRRRKTTAAKKFFRKGLKGCRYVPRVSLTDKLTRDSAAPQERLPGGRAPPASLSAQARRACAPTHPPARTAPARGHVTGARATLPLGVWSHRAALPPPTSPAPRPRIPSSAGEQLRPLAGHHAPFHRRLRLTTQAVVHFHAR